MPFPEEGKVGVWPASAPAVRPVTDRRSRYGNENTDDFDDDSTSYHLKMRSFRRSRSRDDLDQFEEEHHVQCIPKEKSIVPLTTKKSMLLLDNALKAIEAMMSSHDWLRREEMGVMAARAGNILEAMQISDATMTKGLKQNSPSSAGTAAFAKAQYARVLASSHENSNNTVASKQMLMTAATAFRHARILETRIDKAATLGLARTLREMADYENAIREFANLLDALHEAPEALRSIAIEVGELLESRNRIQNAIAVYRRVLKLHTPPWQQGIDSLVRCLTKANRFYEAVTLLEQEADPPKTPQTFLRLGLVRLWTRDRPTQALDAFLSAIDLDPTGFPDAYYYAALALLDTTIKSTKPEKISKALGAAADGLRHCLQIAPTHRAATTLLAKLPTWLQRQPAGHGQNKHKTNSPSIYHHILPTDNVIVPPTQPPAVTTSYASTIIPTTAIRHQASGTAAHNYQDEDDDDDEDDQLSAPTLVARPTTHVACFRQREQLPFSQTPTLISAVSAHSTTTEHERNRVANKGEKGKDDAILDDLDDFEFLDSAIEGCALMPTFPDDSDFDNMLRQPQHFF